MHARWKKLERDLYNERKEYVIFANMIVASDMMSRKFQISTTPAMNGGESGLGQLCFWSMARERSEHKSWDRRRWERRVVASWFLVMERWEGGRDVEKSEQQKREEDGGKDGNR
ncbi:hypothetical protein BHE74_00009109 [Ensete ventricosum]|nr:hypothetical protein BHE74_00009109 [Ensete ventricosum]